MLCFFRRRKPPDKIIFLECWNYFGCVYRVIGRHHGKAMRYTVEIERHQKVVLEDFASLHAANAVALYFLDNGALPGDMQAFSRLPSEGAVYIKRG